jgi:hypothetical protein
MILASKLSAYAEKAKVVVKAKPPPYGNAWVKVPEQIANEFARDLATVPMFGNLEQQHFELPGGAGNISHTATAAYLIGRVIEGASAEETIKSLLLISSEGTVRLQGIFTLFGVVVDSSIDLGNGVSIQPRSTLPVEGVVNDLFYPRDFVSTLIYPHGPPEAAIVVDHQSLRVLREGKHAETSTNNFGDKIEADDSRIVGIALESVMLSSASAPFVGPFYYYVVDEGWPYLRVGGVVGSGRNENWGTKRSRPDPERARQNFAALLMHRDRLAIEIPIRKLMSSRRRNDLAERAIDLGTCMEVLLMHGEQSGNTEIRNKVGIRAAWLLGAGIDDRKRIFDLAKNVYDYRSTGAHEGKLPKKPKAGEIEKIAETLDRGDRLCVEIIEKILDVGDWPKWDSVVIGGGP